jgi:mono/diheme cytochrome c family protein
MAPDHEMNPNSQGPSSMGAKQLYMQLCQRCHAAEGNGRGPIQPNLANFPRAFLNNADFFRSVSDQRLQESLRNGVPGTSMPGYGKLLTQQQVDELLNLVFTAFVNLDRQDKERIRSLPERPHNPVSFTRSDELYVENCQRCHGAFGTGTGPESLEYQPRPRNLRNRPYFNNYPDERIFRAVYDGIQGTAMPAFRDHLDTRDLWGLVDKVKTFSRGQNSE